MGQTKVSRDPKRWRTYTRWCKRCKKYYKSTARHGEVCDKCNIMLKKSRDAQLKHKKEEDKKEKLYGKKPSLRQLRQQRVVDRLFPNLKEKKIEYRKK